ncbi:transposase [Streptomyces sp. NPDC014872]|uniref:transposase n=1 Tax=Streptomyces sp. NPDC014872 TaxID=3364926 RepID=UPI0036F720FF
MRSLVLPPVTVKSSGRPAHVLGGKGHSSKATRTWLRRRGIGHTVPERADQIRNRLRRGSRGGRAAAFDKQLYRQRNVVERCFNRLKGTLRDAAPRPVALAVCYGQCG